MGLTVSQIEADGTAIGHVVGDLRLAMIDVTPDSSWLAAGEALVAADFGLTTLLAVLCESKGGYVFTYDRANGKLRAYYGDNNNASDGALIAVPDTTDISGIGAVRLVAIGR